MEPSSKAVQLLKLVKFQEKFTDLPKFRGTVKIENIDSPSNLQISNWQRSNIRAKWKAFMTGID